MSKPKSDINMKRFPLTISVDLDKRCHAVVTGDMKFKGNRNKFFIDAIERSVAIHERKRTVETVFEGALNDLQLSEPSIQAIEDAVKPDPIPEFEFEVIEPVVEILRPKKPEDWPERRGRKPLLEWRDGGIRNQNNDLYKLYYGPPLKLGQTKQEQFEECKNIPKVVFVPVRKPHEEVESALKRIKIDLLGDFEVMND